MFLVVYFVMYYFIFIDFYNCKVGKGRNFVVIDWTRKLRFGKGRFSIENLDGYFGWGLGLYCVI